MTDLRGEAVTALVALARSPRFEDRADAGRALACFAEQPAARTALLALLLDPADSMVTIATAEALVRRADERALAIVAAGVGAADDSAIDDLMGAVREVLMIYERDRDAAVATCRAFAVDPAQDDAVRRGAADLVDMLTELQPVLRVAEVP